MFGGGCYLILVKIGPWLEGRKQLRVLTDEEKAKMSPMFRKLRKWPEHPASFFGSFIVRGVLSCIVSVILAALLGSNGWHLPYSWGAIYYDLLFARATTLANGAHIVTYLFLPVLGLYVAVKMRWDLLLDIYAGLAVIALTVSLHEIPWMVFYYLEYGALLTPLSVVWPNLLLDGGFIVMLVTFVVSYVKKPEPKVPISAFKWPLACVGVFDVLWYALDGFKISIINNNAVGIGSFNQTIWWGDPLTNGIEVLSWVVLEFAVFLACRAAISEMQIVKAP